MPQTQFQRRTQTPQLPDPRDASRNIDINANAERLAAWRAQREKRNAELREEREAGSERERQERLRKFQRDRTTRIRAALDQAPNQVETPREPPKHAALSQHIFPQGGARLPARPHRASPPVFPDLDAAPTIEAQVTPPPQPVVQKAKPHPVFGRLRILIAVLPALLAAVYLLMLTSPVYRSSAQLSFPGAEGPRLVKIAADLIQSPAMRDQLENSTGFARAFSGDQAALMTRLDPPAWLPANRERRYQALVPVEIDTSASALSVNIAGLTARDAQQNANALLSILAGQMERIGGANSLFVTHLPPHITATPNRSGDIVRITALAMAGFGFMLLTGPGRVLFQRNTKKRRRKKKATA